MDWNYDDRMAEVTDAFSSERRIQAYALLAEGSDAPEIADRLDLSRSGLQPYLADYQETGLVEQEERGEYVLTEKGEEVYDWLDDLETIVFNDAFQELQAKAEQLGFDLEDEEDVERILDGME